MTKADLDRLEAALGVALPASYRTAVADAPEPGDSVGPTWDDADALVELNLRLRREWPDWPEWLVAIGQSDGDPCGAAIDARDPDAPVWHLKRMGLGPDSGPTGETFAARFAQEREDFEVGKLLAAQSRGELRALAVWLALAALAVPAYYLWARLR